MHNEYASCHLCARLCGIDRYTSSRGFCHSGAQMRICRAALHEWEEPMISGTRGSGTVFFSGCSLGCIYCQNREISRAEVGRVITPDGLASVALELEGQGAHNINFVTPTHFIPSIIETVRLARSRGLTLPIVYNTGSYETVDSAKLLKDTVDVYLADYKYYRQSTARALSNAPDYPEVALAAISEMVEQRPVPVINENGIMQSGVVIRILLLPGHLAEAKLALSRLFKAFGNNVFYSLMGQYTVMPGMPAPLDRRVTVSEYRELTDYADRLGITNGFVQDLSSSATDYIPKFDV